MLLLFVVIIFFLLHIQFLLRNLLLGIDEIQFFDFVITYPFDRTVAFESLLFSALCTLAFSLGYLGAKKVTASSILSKTSVPSLPSHSVLLLANLSSLIPIGYMLGIGFSTGFDYGAMVAIRESGTFILELRMIFVLLLSYILLNSGVKNFFRLSYFKSTRWILYVYVLSSFLFQARSVSFEILAVILFAHIVWQKDRIRPAYIIAIIGSLLIPNIIVMGRLGIPGDPEKFLSSLFSFEYSVLINKFLSAAIESGVQVDKYSFAPTLQLILPSPIRDALGWSVQKADYYDEISGLAGITSGGFSLLAEMYSNFGWNSLIVFLGAGAVMGYLNSKAMRIGRISLPVAVAPMLYASFILTFRNDLGVFLKYNIQIFIVACMLQIFLSKRRRQNVPGF